MKDRCKAAAIVSGVFLACCSIVLLACLIANIWVLVDSGTLQRIAQTAIAVAVPAVFTFFITAMLATE